jgi:hypothetical protein
MVLAIAFALAVAAGRAVEAVVIAVLMIPSLLLLGAWAYSAQRGRR